MAILERIGALSEIERAVIDHCSAGAPATQYAPQTIKGLLAPSWLPEVRVPPFDPAHDHLAINERYDLWKRFADGKQRVGVAIEIKEYDIWTDLLKFRRGLREARSGSA